ncbi:LysR family transcriptional regulator [Aquirhabdus parva]|uniref:LysR family transcriptional regulator n=1 Tax=Aquirhabdus parva TaxID=2283318 RepID=A0A345P9Z6_9GAMM|nr:LysR family transcriptional regulator [Aquirhabdus parva]AXI04105.1 LysR family transcriptional regulator [Aquirhabdus parva]
MDLNHLQLFIEVAKAGSFSATAKKLNVERSSISRNIAALEKALGVQLLSRTTRQVALTTAGEQLYRQISPHLDSLQEAVTALPEREEQPAGLIRVTVLGDIAIKFLAGALAGFTARYPAIQVEVHISNHLVDLVNDGIDVALRVVKSKLNDSSLIARPLTNIDMHVYAAPGYLARAGIPRTLIEAADHQWLIFRDMRIPQLVQPTQKPAVTGDDMLFLQEAAKAGIGIAALPTFLARHDVAAGNLVRILPEISITIGVLNIMHPPAKQLSRKVRVFREYLVDYLSVHPLVG